MDIVDKRCDLNFLTTLHLNSSLFFMETIRIVLSKFHIVCIKGIIQSVISSTNPSKNKFNMYYYSILSFFSASKMRYK